jgi:hypothetical protein
MPSPFVDVDAYSIKALCVDKCDLVPAATIAMLAVEHEIVVSPSNANRGKCCRKALPAMGK